ncbi:MAG: lipopolysaccharide biosynthesis protein [Anaerolineae bacterium]|nr:lipopolysaccharide biosynthesis protein [Anaerolineae bacterium]
MADSLRTQVASGIAWTTIARFLTQASRFVTSVFLARLLTPEDFGLVAMVFIFTSFAGMFMDMGIGEAIVQRRDLEADHVNSVFWLNLALGFLLAGVMFLLAPIMATFYRSPGLEAIAKVWSINMPLAMLGVVPGALLKRDLRFRQIAFIDIVTAIAGGIIGIGLAFQGFGVWSIVSQTLFVTIVAVALRWWLSRFKPALRFTSLALRDLWGFTRSIVSFNLLIYLAQNADSVTVGRVFGAAALGFYNRAYGLYALFFGQMFAIFGQVMVPALAKIQTEHTRVRQVFLRLTGLYALFMFPLLMGILVTADLLIVTVYGDQWTASVTALRLIMVAALFQAVSHPGHWVFVSQGKTRQLIQWGLAMALVEGAAYLVGAALGSIETVALAHAVVNVFLMVFTLRLIENAIGLRPIDILKNVAHVFVAAALMGAVVWVMRSLIPPGWLPWQQFLILVCAGAVIYVAIVSLFRIPSAFEAYQHVRMRFKHS